MFGTFKSSTGMNWLRSGSRSPSSVGIGTFIMFAIQYDIDIFLTIQYLNNIFNDIFNDTSYLPNFNLLDLAESTS